MMKNSLSRPSIVQRKFTPAFRGTGPADIHCEHCGHILAANIFVRSLIAVDIECFFCRKLTRTPQWPDGESLPQSMMTLGSSGRFSISELQLNERSSISCDAEIARVESLTLLKQRPTVGSVRLSKELLDSWEVQLNILTQNEFAKVVSSARRARANGNKKFVKCPPAWAIVHLQFQLAENSLGTSPEDAIAIGFMAQLFDLTRRWSHHHHFDIISSSLCNEFVHTATMLAAAGYLTEHGNRVGITDTASASGRSPDLYVNTSPLTRLSLEVKAPDLFFWPSSALSLNALEKHVQRTLKSARDQLSGEDGGVVILGASHPDPGAQETFRIALQNVMDSGKVSSRIAAVAGVFTIFETENRLRTINWQAESKIWAVKNPKFLGENPIATVKF